MAAPDGSRAELMWLMQHVHVRDSVIAHQAVHPTDRAAIEALVQLALSTPDDLRPRLAGAAAAASYAVSDSTVAVWALIDHAGDDSLAALVSAGIDACLSPTILRGVFAETLEVIEERIRAEDAVA